MTSIGPTLCAWCLSRGVVTVLKPAAPGHEQDPISHGACLPCANAWRAESGLTPLEERVVEA